jgi:hypothetical protein
MEIDVFFYEAYGTGVSLGRFNMAYSASLGRFNKASTASGLYSITGW